MRCVRECGPTNNEIKKKEGIDKLKNSGNLLWRTTKTVVEALTIQKEEYNAVMLNKRFEFLTRSIAKLDKIIPECFRVSMSHTEYKVKIKNFFLSILFFFRHFSKQRAKNLTISCLLKYFLNLHTKKETF